MSVQVPSFQKTGSKPSKAEARIEEIVGEEFDVKKFTENFDVLAEAGGGILRLRQCVLGLGLSGGLSGGRSEEWRRVAVGEIADCVLGKMLDKSKHKSGTKRPYLRNINVRWGRVDLGDVFEMYFEDRELDRYGARFGDVLICEGGEPGRAAVWTEQTPVLIQKAIHRVRPGKDLLPDWIVLNLRHDTWTGRLHEYFTGATIKHFTGRALASYEILLPPLAEQKRIVAKVDQLMALCDELEARQTKKRETGTRLTKSALDALTTAERPEEFDAAWTTVVDNFDVLLDKAEKVQEIRQRILALAISGRICRSKRSDGTAQAERPALLSARKDRVTKDPVAPAATNLPSIPPSWCWTSLDSLLVVLRNGVSTRPEGTEGVPVLRISAVRPNAVNMTEIRFLPGKPGDYDGAFVKPGHLLFTRYSGNAEFVGACGVVPEGANAVVHPDKLIRGEVVPGLVDARFVALAMSSGASRAYVDRCAQTTAGQIGISGKQLKAAPVPLAPLAEQRRIVAKVEQLMALCDDLEAKLRRAEDRAAKLVEAVVQELVA